MTTAELTELVRQYSASVKNLENLATGKPIHASDAAGFVALQFTQAI